MAKPESNSAITVEGVSKSFGPIVALKDVSLSVPYGVVIALLGPNGAGETTLVRILTALLKADAGRAKVAGFDVEREVEATQAASFIPIFPLVFVSSVFVPAGTMPVVLETLANISPVTAAVDTMRTLTLGGGPWRTACGSRWAGSLVSSLSLQRYPCCVTAR